MPPFFAFQPLKRLFLFSSFLRFNAYNRIRIAQTLPFFIIGLAATHGAHAASLTHSAQPVQAARTSQTTPSNAPAASRPIAFIDNQPVSFADVAALLMEAAGGQTLLELTLDRRLEVRIALAKITIDAAAIEAERQSLTRTMTAASDNDTAAIVLDRIKAQRGLGERRFAALLRRNAMLRALVKDAVVLTEEILTQTHQALFGPRVTCRLITVATQQDATTAVNNLKLAPAASLEQAFAELAGSISNDSSSGSGGLIAAFALADPNMPLPMRTAAAATAPGGLSAVFQLDNGYGLLFVKSRNEGDGSTLQARRAEVTAAARSRQERLAMERLARLISSEPGVMITDGSLQWSVKSGGFELRP